MGQVEESSCANCRFCIGGHCCRFPPTFAGGGLDRPWVAFPEVEADWWCGEWEGRYSE